jgi:ABC-2 type transport system ATP-binding protein
MSLNIRNLSKTYSNGTVALKDVTLSIPEGMFGLLGPNGAGKSTLMRTIATLQDPDEGSIEFRDINSLVEKGSLRRLLGYLPQDFGVYQNLSSETLLSHFAVLKGIESSKVRSDAVNQVLEATNLNQVRREPLGSYSGGMKQRFGIAQALLGDPDLLIVDEPTAGLDPEERVRFYNLLSGISERTTVLLSTHIVHDIEVLCSELAILNEGRVISSGTPQSLVSDLEGQVWQREVAPDDRESLQSDGRLVSFRLTAGKTIARIISSSKPGEEYSPAKPDLEDVYFTSIKGIHS